MPCRDSQLLAGLDIDQVDAVRRGVYPHFDFDKGLPLRLDKTWVKGIVDRLCGGMSWVIGSGQSDGICDIGSSEDVDDGGLISFCHALERFGKGRGELFVGYTGNASKRAL